MFDCQRFSGDPRGGQMLCPVTVQITSKVFGISVIRVLASVAAAKFLRNVYTLVVGLDFKI